MPNYLVYIFHKNDSTQQNLKSGYYRIVEAGSASEAKRKGVEDLVLNGKGLPGETIEGNMRKARVELYRH